MQIFWIKFRFIYIKKIYLIFKFIATILIISIITTQNKIPTKTKEKKENIISSSNIVELQINNRYMKVNGIQKKIDSNNQDVSPITINGKTFVPIKDVLESLETKMFWITEKNKIIILKDNCTVEMWIDKNEVYINSQIKKIDEAPFIKDNNIYAPLKFVADTLDYKLNLTENDEKIIITNYKDKIDSTRITFWNYDYNLMTDIVEQYKKENSNVKVIKNYIPLEDYNHIIKLLQNSKDNECPDVFCANAYNVKDFVNSKGIFDELNKYDSNSLTKDMFKYTLNMGTDETGTLKAVAGFISPCMIAYKKDLAKEFLGTNDPEKISKMVSTPEKLLETGKRIKELSNGKVKLTPSAEEFFNMFLAGRNKGWIENNEVVIDKNIDKYIDFAKAIKDADMESNIKPWTKEWKATIRDSKHVFYSMPIWGICSTIEKEENLNATGNWGMAEPPDPYFEGGTWFGIYNKSLNKSTAWDFVKFAISNKKYLQETSVLMGKYPNSLKIADNLLKVEYLRRSSVNDNLYKLFYKSALNIDCHLATNYDDYLNSKLSEKLDEYLKGKINRNEIYTNLKK